MLELTMEGNKVMVKHNGRGTVMVTGGGMPGDLAGRVLRVVHPCLAGSLERVPKVELNMLTDKLVMGTSGWATAGMWCRRWPRS